MRSVDDHGLVPWRGWDHDGVGVYFGDAEVAAEVEEIEGAELAGDFDDGHFARGAEEDGEVVYVGSVEVHPEVGEGLVRGGGVARVGGGLDEVLPTGAVVVADEGVHGLGDVEGRLGVAVVLEGDAAERGGGRAFAGEDGVDHVAIERERGVGAGLGDETAERFMNAGRLAGLRGGGNQRGKGDECKK